MKLFKLFLFALALSFVAPQAIDAKPRKKARTHKRVKRGGCRHVWRSHVDGGYGGSGQVYWVCDKCGAFK